MTAMSLKATMRMTMIYVALGCIAIVGVMTGAYWKLEAVQTRRGLADDVGTDVSKFNLLTTELFLQRSERVMHQWSRQYEILLRELDAVTNMGGEIDVLVVELRRRMSTLKRLVESLESSWTQKLAAPEVDERRNILFGSMLAQSGAILSRSLEVRQRLEITAARTRQNIFLFVSGFSMLCVIGCGLELLRISRQLLCRVMELRTVIQTIGDGNLEVEVPTRARDEIGDVFRHLDHMRLSLLNSIGELSRLNLELIAAKCELEGRVEERTASLVAANQELEAFSYAVSHDLRAPLRRINGFAEAILEDHGGSLGEDGRAMLERVRHSARHMNQLIDDLMQLSRINQGLQDVFEVDLSSMAQEIFDNLKERAPERKVTLSLDGKLRAAGDPNMLSILLTNLIENAWKFTSGKPEARIEFGRCLSGGAETFFIRDNGAGFDMAFSEKLFKPFERLHSAAEFAGTGIGLATVSRIVKHHRGRVWAESSPGQGATFFFQLGLKVPRGGIKPVRKPDRERGPRGDAAHEGHPPLLRTGTG